MNAKHTSSARRFMLAYGITALVFLALDTLWLTQMRTRLYEPAIGHLLAPQVDLVAAVLFYLIFWLGVVVFAVRPFAADAGQRWQRATLRGGLFGLVSYATYDFTNQATLIGWPWWLTAIDLAWGAFITATAAGVARVVAYRT